mmetsp:Transcript_67195/g.108231  ORF Transcript_67195/g.108231 Transcript_67195/m.108231 type:complete len:85 (-) Transcript_67195:84-338(-)
MSEAAGCRRVCASFLLKAIRVALRMFGKLFLLGYSFLVAAGSSDSLVSESGIASSRPPRATFHRAHRYSGGQSAFFCCRCCCCC